jgi:DNA-binding CsgD family transcriptional regulator
MGVARLLEAGGRAFEAQDWGAAYDALSAAASAAELDAGSLVRLGMAAYLAGTDEQPDASFGRAFRAAVSAGDTATAVRAAFWASFALANVGEDARARGWAGRARRLLGPERAGPVESVERCQVDLLEALLDLRAGVGEPRVRFTDIARRAAGLRERDLEALAGMGEGYCLVAEGALYEGMERLDEVMVAVTGDEVHPMAAGLIYCVVLEVCQCSLDLHRSAQWTAAVTRWCDAQPGLVPYRGQCLVHRVQVMQLRGDWRDAVGEAERACAWLSRPPQPAIGAALYEWGELFRLRGELARAEAKFGEASRWGHDPQPGLALLRLAQGAVEAAVHGLARTLAEPQDATVLPSVLAAYVDALLAGGDQQGARAAADRLRAMATDLGTPMVDAYAAQADAEVELAAGDPVGALRNGRRAWRLWHELDAPYLGARSRMVVGEACRVLGDEDAAMMEVEAARSAFQRLDARLDLLRATALLGPKPAGDAGPLSTREREVIRLVAAGHTNRQIAIELTLSEKTVARHLSNIFAKIDVTTRTAAAAYAFSHDLA